MKYLIPQDSYGIVEIFIASSIFFSPNVLIFLSFFNDKPYLFLIYDFLIIYLLVSVVTHKQCQLLSISREKYKKE